MVTKDINLAVRAISDGALISDDFTSSEIRLKGGPMAGYALEVNIPDYSGTAPVLDIFIYGHTATGTDSDDPLLGKNELQLDSDTCVGTHIIPFNVPLGYEYFLVRMETGGTTPNFSLVQAWIVQNPGKAWSRTIHFD